MTSLDQFYQPVVPQTEPSYQTTLSLADLALERDQAVENAKLEEGILTRNYRTRTIPGIVNRQAGRGAFFSGGTGVKLGQAAEDVQTETGRMELALQQRMQDILRQQYRVSLGLSL